MKNHSKIDDGKYFDIIKIINHLLLEFKEKRDTCNDNESRKEILPLDRHQILSNH